MTTRTLSVKSTGLFRSERSTRVSLHGTGPAIQEDVEKTGVQWDVCVQDEWETPQLSLPYVAAVTREHMYGLWSTVDTMYLA